MAACLVRPAAALTVVDPGQTPFVIQGIGTPELSGWSHVGGGEFLAVADSGGTLHRLQVALDPSTAFVTGVTGSAPVALAGGVDLEGAAWRASSGTLFVSDEVGPAVQEVDPLTGAIVGGLGVPSIYGSAVFNRSLESLTLAPDESAFWIANETALLPDGPDASPAGGTLVRLQRFDASGAPNGQWAYLSEPGLLVGVVELVALPTGDLLVLERALGIQGFEARLFAVDFAGATETSALPSLAAGGVQPVTKSLLWTRPTILNVEAISLGPNLSGGDLSLLLTSDGAGSVEPVTFALRLLVPEPGLLLPALAGLFLARRRLT
jgi:hypothetical protein